MNRRPLKFLTHQVLCGIVLSETAAAQEAQRKTVNLDPPRDWFLSIWRFRLFTVEGSDINVSQVVVAILILLIGIAVSRFITRRLKRQMLRGGRIEENTAEIVQRVLFYLLLVIVVISSFQMVSIPMTIFTFLGGAVAIGAGFGAQNIFNNFISGMILMTEQPVRLNDLIEIDGYLGRVSHIGARCTRIRRIDGIEMLVPNSTLLENNLINRTLSDKVIRTDVSVGVAYGSPVAQVRDILQEIAEAHDQVLEDPPPVVLFEEFGDNALVFKVYVWVELLEAIDLRIIRSEIRFEVDARFREADITIAFPQRDLHFDGDRVRVELVDRPAGQADGDGETEGREKKTAKPKEGEEAGKTRELESDREESAEA